MCWGLGGWGGGGLAVNLLMCDREGALNSVLARGLMLSIHKSHVQSTKTTSPVLLYDTI